MIYLDTSVALAWLLGEDRHPPPGLWQRSLVSSRLLQYELWTRLHSRGLGVRCAPAAEDLVARVLLIELAAPVLERVLEPFPQPLRTLDALHLATALYLRDRRQRITVATYDDRMRAAAESVGLTIAADIG